ncbi:MAG: hydrogenase formation protein HypD [Ignavibacteria bacterium GWA2_55_11]|nr:MAG: hydrogenase formation protein HypD [Ignavibacteria bacterium GWA2_55_11]OGU44080.1 MAG: hydrogenase formation protein HypD [Ignavibacteria bacterium GWC2_56_12]HAV23618.1 hydrogenase formation protein HypD [Bacteroidota bacterium]
MKHVDVYRSEAPAWTLLREIKSLTTRPWTIMEICGGQTHAIVKSGLEDLLPKSISLVHGPGCPVCVTPVETLDKAMAIAALPGIIFTSFGDMLRVPGSSLDLLTVKSRGADVRFVYSPLDAVHVAQANPDREVVFFGVGFETTAPANAMAVVEARRLNLHNFSMLSSHVLVLPAIEAILGSPDNRVQGFLAAGHVCTIMGYEAYEPLAHKYRVPMIVTGFEPVDILQGIMMAVRQLETGRSDVENQYARAVRREGNRRAQKVMNDVFEVCDKAWRGLGMIPKSGLRLRHEVRSFDAEYRFGVERTEVRESPLCFAGDVLRGMKKPTECPSFGGGCIPEHPLGAPMVSSEGSCAAYFRYRRIVPRGAA